MSDALHSRVTRIVMGSVHALLDKVENVAPASVFMQSVREIEQVADEVRAELGLVAANHYLAQQQRSSLDKEYNKLTSALSVALGDNRDDLAKSAIARQMDIETQLPILDASLATLVQQTQELSGFVDALVGKKREMEAAIHAFETSRQRPDKTNASPAGSSNTWTAKIEAAKNTFDTLYQNQTGLNVAGHSIPLAQTTQLNELHGLVRENTINERLAALKAKQ